MQLENGLRRQTAEFDFQQIVAGLQVNGLHELPEEAVVAAFASHDDVSVNQDAHIDIVIAAVRAI